MKWLLAIFALLWPVGGSAQGGPAEAPRIYLMTIGVGGTVDSRFGHDAIWVQDRLHGTDLVYNFGTYDFTDPLFVPKFVKGKPLYTLSVWPLQATLDIYAELQRRIEVQELDLSPAQRTQMAYLLALNSEPANRAYHYDYYLDNCATRIRDLLDQVLGGSLRQATEGKPAEGNLRFHTQRALTNNLFIYFGVLALIGPSADQPLDQWGEMFLPAKIQERLRELTLTDADGNSRPLVSREWVAVDVDRYRVEPAPPSWGWQALVVGMILAGLILLARSSGYKARLGLWLMRGWLLCVGLAGLLLILVWFGTDHQATAHNRNLLLLSPLALAWPFLSRSGGASRILRWLLALSLVSGGLLALFPWLGGQWNLQLAALVIPPTASALAVFGFPGDAKTDKL